MGTVQEPKPPEGRREANKRATRLALRAAAARRITADGVAKTRVADIAADCGVSERTFFRYFTTKEQAALDPLVEWIDGIVSAIEDAPYTVPLFETATRLIDQGKDDAFPFGPEQVQAGILYYAYPEMQMAFSANMETFRSRVIDQVATRTGTQPQDAFPRALGSAMSAAMLGVIEAWLLGGCGDDLWDLVATVLVQAGDQLARPIPRSG